MKTAKEIYMTTLGESTIETDLQVTEKAMIEFAKIHVQTALKEASEKAEMYRDVEAIDRESILRAYSIKNII